MYTMFKRNKRYDRTKDLEFSTFLLLLVVTFNLGLIFYCTNAPQFTYLLTY